MTEALTTSLAHLPRLKVIDTRSTNRFRDTNKPAPEIGAALDATYILQWALQARGGGSASRLSW